MLKAAVEAARAAGEIQRRRFRGDFAVRRKGAVDLVTDVDLACEEAIRETLARLCPGTTILSEEEGLTGTSRDRWIVDPLDGTTNFAHAYPVFCASIAWEEGGRVRAGVIYDPLRDELFEAEEGRGARLNGTPLAVSREATLDGSLLATGFPYDRRTNPRNNLEAFTRLTLLTQGVRRSGAAAIDLAYVAAGRLDGFWEPGLKPWDTAAGALLVTEAGGSVTGYRGEPYVTSNPDVLATNGQLHPELLSVIEKLDSGSP
jgi:myo-inositol-1(or 4)-monophosphatase